MGTRTARTKLETHIKNQKGRIAELQKQLEGAKVVQLRLEDELARAKQGVVWQRKRVAKRDEQIKEIA